MNPKLVGAVAIAVVAAAAIYWYTDREDIQDGTAATEHIVPPEKIRDGGPPRDGIPSIDDPRFAAAAGADLSGDEMVIGLDIGGDVRAYPLSIMVWHEIVNDHVGGAPVAVTYCPLCYTSQVFVRTIHGQPVEFGTSGKLYNSNLLMYDRLTDSYWSQALGVAVAGELAGQRLDTVPFDVMEWRDWRTLHPDSLVMTTETGHARAYGVDPYGTYYADGRIMFPLESTDDRLHPKEIILGLYAGGAHKAYRQQDIEDAVVINDRIGGIPVLITSAFAGNARAFERTLDGAALDFEYRDGRILDVQTGSEWNYDGESISGAHDGRSLARLSISPGFWFEWAAFHPGTPLYGE